MSAWYYRLKYRVKHMLSCAKALNRRVEIENVLLSMYQGKTPLPDKEQCRVLALKLGTPKELWIEEWKL